MRLRLANRDGAMLLFIAISILGIMGLMSIALDGGMIQRERRMMQSAADGAALAAVVEMYRARPESIAAAAISEATRNGYTNGVASVTVTDTTPTTSGVYVGSSFVKVDITKTVNTVFGAIIGRPTALIHAQAVAGLGAATETCVVLTDTTGTSLSLASGAKDTASSCGVNVNSNGTPAVSVSNNGTVLSTMRLSVTGSTFTQSTSNATITGTVTTGAPRVPNPLATLTMPSFSTTCDAAHTNVKVQSGAHTTLSPGVYCNGLTVQNNGSIATLSEGTYILIGRQGSSALSVQSGATIQSSGDGVTIIIGANASGQYGTVNLQSGATINLSADTDPTTTSYPGILFFMDPAAPRGTQVIQSQAGATINGTLYFPNQQVQIESAGLLTINGGLVAGSLTSQSAGAVKFTGYGGGGSSYFKLTKPSLVQ